MIDIFIQKVNELFEVEKYKEVFDLCTKELNKIFGNNREPSVDEYDYIATIYSVLAEVTDSEEALKCLDCAINFVPNNEQLYIQRATVKEEMGDFKGAIEDYSIILDNIDSIEAYGARGNAKMSIGDLNGAAEDFKAIIQLEPNNVSAKKAYVSIKANQAQDGIQGMSCTLTTGEEVVRFIIDNEIIDIPAEQY